MARRDIVRAVAILRSALNEDLWPAVNWLVFLAEERAEERAEGQGMLILIKPDYSLSVKHDREYRRRSGRRPGQVPAIGLIKI